MLQSSRRLSLLQIACLGGSLATTTTLVISVGCRVRAELQDGPKALVDEVWQVVNRRYVDNTFNAVDWQATRQNLLSKNYTSKEQAYTAVREALKQLGDPYTRFLAPEEYQALNEESIYGQLSGALGIQVKQDEKTKQLTVEDTLLNSPARKAGLKAGDRIVAIDGKPTKEMKKEDASKLIRGKAGTAVTLQIKRQQKILNLKVTRANFELPKVSYTLKQEGAKRIGYIRLTEFSATAPKQMRGAIASLNSKRVNGFVLDLRGNPGGLFLASVDIARMWIDNGAIVCEVERDLGSKNFSADRTALTKQPLVVLVDGNSASASEILAGALKDNKRAVVVGSQTFGKALVQQLQPLSDGSGMTVTVGHYFTPKGTDINHKGIAPNVRIDLTSSQQKQLATKPTLLGTKSDPQYRRAIAVLASNAFTAYSPSPVYGKTYQD